MVFNTGAALLDAIVLAVVSREDEGTYGYKITQDVRKAIDVSESTLYPVLRRLQKGEYLEVYDRQFDGRNRRYYKAHDEEGQDHGQQLDAEGQRLFLQLGDRLNEAQQDADERGHDDGRHRQHEHQIERFHGVIDGG